MIKSPERPQPLTMKYGMLKQHEEPFIRSAVNESPMSPKQPRTQLLPSNGNASIATNPNYPNQSMMQQKRRDSFQVYQGAGSAALSNAHSIGAAMLD